MDLFILFISSIILYFIVSKQNNIQYSVMLVLLLGIREGMYTYGNVNNIDNKEFSYWNKELDLLFYFIIFVFIGYQAYNLDKTMPKRKSKYFRTFCFIILLCFGLYLVSQHTIFHKVRPLFIPLFILTLIKIVYTL